MIKPTSISKRGFTLVELLVVIALIAVLAAAGFAGGNAAIQKARKTTALSVCTGVETAVNNFFTEYGGMPNVESGTDVDTTLKTDTQEGLDFLEVLLAREDDEAEEVWNVRGIKFLNVKEGKGGKNGLIFDNSGTTLEGLFDPWGGPYNVELDTDYDEVLEVQPKGAASAKTLNGRRVAVWSDGADGAGEGTTGAVTDDVTTW